MTHQAAIDSLYNVTMNDTLWPASKRVIYCSVSGRPWGVVSEDYVQETIMAIGGNEEQMKEIISRMTLFSGPSPLWQSHVPMMITKNKLLDPAGFLVYMLNVYLKLQYTGFMDLDTRIQWRHDMTRLYAFLDKFDREYINTVNDIMLMLSGEGFKPPLHVLPSKQIADYMSKEVLDKLVQSCNTYYNRRKNQKNIMLSGNQVHKRAYLHDNDLEQSDEETKDNLYKLMLTELFQKVDAGYTKAEVKRAKVITGIASPTLMNLNMDQMKAIRTKETAYKRMGAPSKVLQPGETFVIGGKKND